MRLNRYLAACGLGSRRSCEALIVAGRVTLNGAPGQLGSRVAAGDVVCVDGAPVSPVAERQVWMLHKPAGILCTARDPQGRPTVLEWVASRIAEVRVFPVGRLDRDTTGLLLLTNDGELGHRLLHPSHKVEKEYEAWVASALQPDALERLRAGIELDDGPTAPCRVHQEIHADGICVRMVLREGRKRQIRRMLEAVGHPVQRLHRVRLGPIRLGDLPRGAVRRLDAGEIAELEACLQAGAGTAAGPAS